MTEPKGSVGMEPRPLTFDLHNRAECIAASGAVEALHKAGFVVKSAEPNKEETEPCKEFVQHFIAGASWYLCVLEKGHEGGHRAGGTCFRHGSYVGDVDAVPQCPHWPTCVHQLVSPSPLEPPIGSDVPERVWAEFGLGEHAVAPLEPLSDEQKVRQMWPDAHCWQDEDGHFYISLPHLGDAETEENAWKIAAASLSPAATNARNQSNTIADVLQGDITESSVTFNRSAATEPEFVRCPRCEGIETGGCLSCDKCQGAGVVPAATEGGAKP